MAYEMAVHGLQHRHARLSGEQKTLQEHVRRLAAMIARARTELSEAEARLAKIDQQKKVLEQTAQLAFASDISSTEARRTWPKSHTAAWGALTRAILSNLRNAAGVAMTTADLAQGVEQTLGLDLDADGLSKLQENVRHRLKALRNRGLVQRVHDGAAKGTYSTWVIKDTAE